MATSRQIAATDLTTAGGPATLTIPSANTTNPLFTVIWDGNTAPGVYPRGILGDSVDDQDHSFHFEGRKARGTRASKAALQSGDYTAAFCAGAYDGSAYQTTGFLTWLVTAAPTSGVRVPSKFAISTMGAADTSSQFRWYVDENRLVPATNNQQDIGSTSVGIKNLYANGVMTLGRLSQIETSIFSVQTTTINNVTAAFVNTDVGTPLSAGAGIAAYQDSGAAVLDASRLGYFFFGGAKDASHSLGRPSGIASFSVGNWSGSATGAMLNFYTTASGTTSRLERGRITDTGSWLLGIAALATNATDGFPYIPSGAGAPSGTPSAQTGMVPLYYDSSNNQLYIYNSGWKQPKTPSAAALVTWQ
jgi:hypothetical protein